MGRPLRKDINGLDVIKSPTSTSIGVTVKYYDHVASALRTDGVLVKQRGAKTFIVARVGDVNTAISTSENLQSLDNANKFTCKLVDGTPSAEGEMQLTGSTAPNATSNTNLINCAKITKRIFTDFSGNRYKWYIQSDSSLDYIVLTAV
jgi:hypothetical protein